jgi:hypothetical protein
LVGLQAQQPFLQVILLLLAEVAVEMLVTLEVVEELADI